MNPEGTGAEGRPARSKRNIDGSDDEHDGKRMRMRELERRQGKRSHDEDEDEDEREPKVGRVDPAQRMFDEVLEDYEFEDQGHLGVRAENRKIVASILAGVDVSEVYCPARVTQACAK